MLILFSIRAHDASGGCTSWGSDCCDNGCGDTTAVTAFSFAAVG